MLCEIFVFKEGGDLFPWQNLWDLAVRCVGAAVYALGFARVAKFSPSKNFPLQNNPRTKLAPPTRPVYIYIDRLC